MSALDNISRNPAVAISKKRTWQLLATLGVLSISCPGFPANAGTGLTTKAELESLIATTPSLGGQWLATEVSDGKSVTVAARHLPSGLECKLLSEIGMTLRQLEVKKLQKDATVGECSYIGTAVADGNNTLVGYTFNIRLSKSTTTIDKFVAARVGDLGAQSGATIVEKPKLEPTGLKVPFWTAAVAIDADGKSHTTRYWFQDHSGWRIEVSAIGPNGYPDLIEELMGRLLLASVPPAQDAAH